MKSVSDRLAAAHGSAEEHTTVLTDLKSKIAADKLRILTLSSLCGPILEFTDLYHNHALKQCSSYDETLFHMGSSVSTNDYGRVFKVTAHQNILSSLKLRSMDTAYDEGQLSQDSVEAMRMICHWLNNLSRSLVTIYDPTPNGDPFETRLPNHEQVYDLQNLRSGRTLSRGIFALIYYGAEIPGLCETGEPIDYTLIPKPTTYSGISDRVRKSNKRILNSQEINELKFVEGNAAKLITLSLQYANKFLSIPLFKSSEIRSGNQTTILALVGCLMFSSQPLKNDEDIVDAIGLLETQSKIMSEIAICKGRIEYATKNIKNITIGINHYYGIDNEKNLIKENDDISVSQNNKSNGPSSTIMNESSTDLNESKQVETEEEKYHTLLTSIDELTQSNEFSLMKEAIENLNDLSTKLGKLQDSIDEMRIKKDTGIRLATDIRCFIINNCWMPKLGSVMKVLDTVIDADD